jgi:hypothetical protein
LLMNVPILCWHLIQPSSHEMECKDHTTSKLLTIPLCSCLLLYIYMEWWICRMVNMWNI